MLNNARYDPEVGYCQGLAFIVAALLLNVSWDMPTPILLTLPDYNRCLMKKHSVCLSASCTHTGSAQCSSRKCLVYNSAFSSSTDCERLGLNHAELEY